MDIIKVTGSIWARLFDHKVFLNGELQFTLREFEQSRGDHEVENLFSLLENITDTKDTQIVRLESCSHTLRQLDSNLGVCLDLCAAISETEAQFARDSTLQELRDKRKAEWQRFVDEITFKCSQIDNTFQEKEEELQDLYRDLERKLDTSLRLV